MALLIDWSKFEVKVFKILPSYLNMPLVKNNMKRANSLVSLLSHFQSKPAQTDFT
jgi:hypothetical protein